MKMEERETERQRYTLGWRGAGKRFRLLAHFQKFIRKYSASGRKYSVTYTDIKLHYSLAFKSKINIQKEQMSMKLKLFCIPREIFHLTFFLCLIFQELCSLYIINEIKSNFYFLYLCIYYMIPWLIWLIPAKSNY